MKLQPLAITCRLASLVELSTRGDVVKISVSFASGLLLALTGCVGDRADLGGVDRPGPMASDAIPCREARLTRVEAAEPSVPDDVAMFYVAAQVDHATSNMLMRYDVDENGKALNIRYAGPPEDTRHSTQQKIIRSASEFLQSAHYAWASEPGFATGCEFELQYLIDWKRAPGGEYDNAKKE